MDTKLKKYKMISILIAVGIITAAALGFRSLYVSFAQKAAEYETDVLHSDRFLEALGNMNDILYKDIVQKVDQKNYSYADLFFDKSEQAEVLDEIRDQHYIMRPSEAEERINAKKRAVEAAFEEQEEELLGDLAKRVDYCAVDNNTGQFVKNTGNNIEALAKNDSNGTETDYQYYIKVTYDNAGNLENISTKSSHSEELLKAVRNTMNNRLPMVQFGDEESFYYEQQIDETVQVTGVTYSIVNPVKSMTYVYALSAEQMTYFLHEHNTVGYDGENVEIIPYIYAGTYSVYALFLLAVAVPAFLLCFHQKYQLRYMKLFHLPLELILAGITLPMLMSDSVVMLLNETNRGHLAAVYKNILPRADVFWYSYITEVINFAVLFFAFFTAFYIATAMGEVCWLGMREYLNKRCLIVRGCKAVFSFCRKYYMRFKQEILYLDLGKETKKTLQRAVILNFVLLAIISVLWVFGWAALVFYSIVLYFILKKYIQQIKNQYAKLLKATGAIADGNLHTVIEENLGVFESYKEELYKIQNGLRNAVDEEVKSQRLKTELITNVSHDLKTPLTAMTTYIDLLKEDNITKEQRKEYMAVLERKASRLKILIEDLFEVSKADSRNVTMNFVDVDIFGLIRQLYHEHEDRIEDADLLFRFVLPEEKVFLQLDSQKAYRIFDNLYSNIIKYAMPHTRVYIDAEKIEDKVIIALKNMSASELNVKPEELTERFVRGDSARNTEGSGLGLAIAQSFTELMNGKMKVSTDGDLFKVTLEWKL